MQIAEPTTNMCFWKDNRHLQHLLPTFVLQFKIHWNNPKISEFPVGALNVMLAKWNAMRLTCGSSVSLLDAWGWLQMVWTFERWRSNMGFQRLNMTVLRFGTRKEFRPHLLEISNCRDNTSKRLHTAQINELLGSPRVSLTFLDEITVRFVTYSL